ncbi:hypothetical protein BHM03_00040200 [Ensete ventricosum]|nr:hypothetical protein BHM03_00040200 [Ensete ventricosum]
MGAVARGTITSLETLFPPVEAQMAARRVEEAIADRRNELRLVQGFVSDNSSLINLARTLPEELSHDVMVLLGEGYYAERTAKQTVEILQRRGKALERQVESLKATMVDLEAEAKFFDSTAAEAAEGLVEIREEYVEESEKKVPGSGTMLHFHPLLHPLDDSTENIKPSTGIPSLSRYGMMRRHLASLENDALSPRGRTRRRLVPVLETRQCLVLPREDEAVPRSPAGRRGDVSSTCGKTRRRLVPARGGADFDGITR